MRSSIGPVVGFIVLTVSACSGQQQAAGIEEALCLKEGGDWRRVCSAQRYQCVRPFSDGGKACRDSSECQGGCIVDLTVKCEGIGKCADFTMPKSGERTMGVCKRDDDPCGSFIVVREGVAESVTHTD